MLDTVCSSAHLDFTNYIPSWSEYFAVKDSQSLAVSHSATLAISVGYKNPIDYLGGSDYDMKCPTLALADIFIAQDKKIIKTKSAKSYLMATMYANEELSLYFLSKQFAASHIVCNTRKLKTGTISKEFYAAIQAIPPSHHKEINKCYEIVDFYSNLSVRETEIMYFLMNRKSSSEIGRILKLSHRTIQNYAGKIKLKMHCSSIQQLVEFGLYLGLNEKIPSTLIY